MCVDRTTLGFASLTDRDRSDSQTICRPLDEVVDVAKYGYYVAKTIALLLG